MIDTEEYIYGIPYDLWLSYGYFKSLNAVYMQFTIHSGRHLDIKMHSS